MLAATPASDPQWSAIVAWAIYALERAELAGDAMGGVGPRFRCASRDGSSASPTIGKSASSAPPDPTPTSMRATWAKARASSFPAGSNAPIEAGGLFVMPYRE